MAIQTSDNQRANILHVQKLTGGGRKHHVFDFSDVRQYEYARDALIAAGQTPERYPGLHKALAQSRDHHVSRGAPKALAATADDGGQDAFMSGPQITNLGVIPPSLPSGGRVSGTGFHTQIGGTSMTNVVCQITNTATGAVLASGSNSQYNMGEFVPVQTLDSTSTTPAPQMTGAVLYMMQLTPGGPIESGVVSYNLASLVIGDPTVTQPTKWQSPNPPPYIVIGLGRGNGTTSNVDYWFWQDQFNYPNLAVPLVGNVTFSAPIQTLVPGSTINLFVTLAKQGGGYANPVDLTHVYSKFTIDGNNNKQLDFNLPATGVQSTTDPIVFGVTTWNSEVVTYFTCNMIVNLVGQPLPASATIMSVDNPDMDPIDGTKYIRPIQFVWHCLAEGTLITMADGSTPRIEELKGGERVRVDNKGGEREIDATFAGPHYGPAIYLKLSDGKELTLSQGHIVILADGKQVMAEELHPGDSIVVLGGTAKVESASRGLYRGALFNLSLLGPPPTTMFANGILVGDQQMQSTIRRQRKTHPDTVRRAIDPLFLADYESHLQDVAAKIHTA
ncbi:MAG TPA: Hint domain-containing protein [Rhizomicrobium sp.]|nr:Hint domain-containing protein [Rhizomicrobium sp.]